MPVAHVVDTVGAGDGFAVGMISALLEHQSFAEAVQRANWIGSRAVQSRGDMEGLPTRAELFSEFEAAIAGKPAPTRVDVGNAIFDIPEIPVGAGLPAMRP
ncbi:2-dehydro-3-deoxygluconokinase [compost metagenome]